MTRLGLLGCVTATLAILGSAIAASPEPTRPDWCPTKMAARTSHAPAGFRPLADKLAHGETLRFVAIGSSSTEGSDLPNQRLAYPTHLEQRLNGLYGQRSIAVLNKGKGGETIADVLARFERDVIAERPDLVIWQLGTNDIVRKLDVQGVRAGVSSGLSRLQALGIPVVLMDSQNSPKVMTSPVREPMEQMIRDEAKRVNALVWSRYGLMDTILNAGSARTEDLISQDGLHMSVAMHACTGAVLAETIAGHLAATNQDVMASVQPRR